MGGFGGLRWLRKVCDIGSSCSFFAQARNNSSWVPDEVHMPFGICVFGEYNHSNTNVDHEAGGIDTASEGACCLALLLNCIQTPIAILRANTPSVDNHLPIGQQDRQIMNMWL